MIHTEEGKIKCVSNKRERMQGGYRYAGFAGWGEGTDKPKKTVRPKNVKLNLRYPDQENKKKPRRRKTATPA